MLDCKIRAFLIRSPPYTDFLLHKTPGRVYFKKTRSLMDQKNSFNGYSSLIQDTVAAWHTLLKTKDARVVIAILADNVVFYFPGCSHPQEGKLITTLYLPQRFMFSS
jgi:hypothetical protein